MREERPKATRATANVTIAQAIAQVSSFARYAFVARLISPAEFGIAALIAAVAQFVETINTAGADSFLIQAPDGDREDVQAAIHMLRALRGIVSAAIIIALAGPVTTLLGLSEYVAEMRILAMMPLIRGFTHTDSSRLQRELSFTPSTVTEVVSSITGSLVTVGMALAAPDHRSVLLGVLVQSATAVLLSHTVAERPYRWKYDRACFRRFVQFTWPIIAEAPLIFGITQGDKLLMGSARTVFGNTGLTLASLGIYSATTSLGMVPSLSVCNILLKLGLPYLAREKSEPGKPNGRYERLSQWTYAVTGAYLATFVLFGPDLIRAVSGSKFSPTYALILMIALTAGLRILRTAPIVSALSRGETKNGLYSNFGRLFGLAATSWVVWMNGTIEEIAFCGVAGELAATGISVIHCRLPAAEVRGVLLRVSLLGAFAATAYFVRLDVTVPLAVRILMLPLPVVGLLWHSPLVWQDVRAMWAVTKKRIETVPL